MKYKKIILLLVAFLLFLPTLLKAQEPNATCNDDLITIDSISIEQKDEEVIQNSDPVIDGKNIKLDLNMSYVGNSIQYKIVVKNDSEVDYELGSNLNTSTNYMKYTYTSAEAGNIVKAGTSKILYLKVEYDHEVPDTAFTNGTFTDNKDLVINLSSGTDNTNTNTNTNVKDEIKNPKTGTEATLLFIIVVIFVAGIGYIAFSKAKTIRHLVIIFGVLAILPLTVYAACTCQINVESKVTIEQMDDSPVYQNITTLRNKANVQGTGLYTDSTNVDRYVYRGSNPPNYFRIDDYLMRIIAIEPDKKLKLIVVNNSPILTLSFDTSYEQVGSLSGVRQGSGATRDDFCYNTNPTSYLGCKVWGSSNTTYKNGTNGLQPTTTFPIGAGTKNLPTEEASINVALNNTIDGWFSTLSDGLKFYIKEAWFNVGPTDTDEDRESEYLWKGKVGIMNTSDYFKASANSSCNNLTSYVNTSSCFNSDNYLRQNGIHEWTLNPTIISNTSKVWSINTDGSLDASSSAKEAYFVRPVVYIDLTHYELDGTGVDPENAYTIHEVK